MGLRLPSSLIELCICCDHNLPHAAASPDLMAFFCVFFIIPVIWFQMLTCCFCTSHKTKRALWVVANWATWLFHNTGSWVGSLVTRPCLSLSDPLSICLECCNLICMHSDDNEVVYTNLCFIFSFFIPINRKQPSTLPKDGVRHTDVREKTKTGPSRTSRSLEQRRRTSYHGYMTAKLAYTVRVSGRLTIEEYVCGRSLAILILILVPSFDYLKIYK